MTELLQIKYRFSVILDYYQLQISQNREVKSATPPLFIGQAEVFLTTINKYKKCKFFIIRHFHHAIFLKKIVIKEENK